MIFDLGARIPRGASASHGATDRASAKAAAMRLSDWLLSRHDVGRADPGVWHHDIEPSRNFLRYLAVGANIE